MKISWWSGVLQSTVLLTWFAVFATECHTITNISLLCFQCIAKPLSKVFLLIRYWKSLQVVLMWVFIIQASTWKCINCELKVTPNKKLLYSFIQIQSKLHSNIKPIITITCHTAEHIFLSESTGNLLLNIRLTHNAVFW